MRFKNTANRIKRLLLVSSVLMILCSFVFMGASYAWFTDTDMVTNRVLVGKLNIDLLMYKERDGKIAYHSIDDGVGDIFMETDPQYAIFPLGDGRSNIWEPGKTEIVYLAVENKGDVELDYYFKLRLADFGLADSLEFVIIDDAKVDTFTSHSWSGFDGITTWEQLVALAESSDAHAHADLKSLLDSVTPESITYETVYDPAENLLRPNVPVNLIRVSNEANGHLPAHGDIDYFALAVHMKEDAGNDYQNKSIVFDVAVLGQQVYTTPDEGWFKN